MPIRGGSTATPTGIRVAERRAAVLRLRRHRPDLTYDQIADVMRREYGPAGYDRAAVYRDLQSAMRTVVRLPAEEMRAEQLDWCDVALGGLSKGVTSGDPPSVRAAIAVLDHKAKLAELYAPQRHEVLTADVTGLLDLTDPGAVFDAALASVEASATRHRVIEQ